MKQPRQARGKKERESKKEERKKERKKNGKQSDKMECYATPWRLWRERRNL